MRPERVIATKPTKSARSRREVDTAAPVAERLGLRLVDDHGHGQLPGLVKEVLSDPAPALVIWHHGEIPAVPRRWAPTLTRSRRTGRTTVTTCCGCSPATRRATTTTCR